MKRTLLVVARSGLAVVVPSAVARPLDGKAYWPNPTSTATHLPAFTAPRWHTPDE